MGLGQFADSGGGLGKKEAGGAFEGGWYPNAHYDPEQWPRVAHEATK